VKNLGIVLVLKAHLVWVKCLAKDTPIMLSNGEIKMVQNITLEDKLMGDDSTPRNILDLGIGIRKNV